jgi:hypothetical protein
MPPSRAHDHVVVSVEPSTEAEEELAVTVLSDGTYQLLVPPALAAGLAVGDVFQVDPATRRPTVIRRSGNLTIWLYPHGANDEARDLGRDVNALGGTFDGSAHGDAIFIFTMPIEATFPAVEELFNRFVEHHPASEWYFGNVYADDGVTPLGWWDRPSA